jgi:Flp pilus assembly protein TadD
LNAQYGLKNEDSTEEPPMKHSDPIRSRLQLTCVLALALLCGACAFKESGYGAGAQAERAAAEAVAAKDPAPDTPGMYLALIDRMQKQGLYYASLAHIDAYEKQYGATPDSTLLRADALRETGQPEASARAYRTLLSMPLAAQGHHGLGLLAGAAGDFRQASRELSQAVALAPTDAATLSDLGYALLRDGDVAGARVPLMQAAELDSHSARIKSNLALLLLAQGHVKEARAWMDGQQFTPAVRMAIRDDAAKIASAARAHRPGITSSRDSLRVPNVSAPATTLATFDGETR